MNKEVRFQEMLKDLCMLAKVNRNKVTKKLVVEFFEELELSDEQMTLIYAYLKEQKIEVVEESDSAIGVDGADFDSGDPEVPDTEDDLQLKEFDEKVDKLCREILSGDSSKKQELIEHYESKMKSYVKGFLQAGLLEEDLLQEATLGLLLAVETLSVKAEELTFAAFLESGIENQIRSALEEEYQAEKADEELERNVNEFHKKLLELGEELERKPSIEEVCMYMKLSEEEVNYFFRLMGDTQDN